MTNSGQCVWYDLFSNQPEKSKAFYGELFNWSTEAMKTPAGDYTIFKSGDKAVAGMTTAPLASLNNTWLAYVSVDNLDTAVSTLQKNGGKTLLPEIKMPGVGRWVVAQDAQGATFCPFEGDAESKDCASSAAFGGPWQFCWHELMCQDYKAALKYYGEIFSWKAGQAMDMGPAGTYQLYGNGSTDIGGIMNITPEMGATSPYWLEYVYVEDVDQTVARAKRLGATPTFPCMDVGGGTGRIAGLKDPNGAALALYTSLKK